MIPDPAHTPEKTGIIIAGIRNFEGILPGRTIFLIGEFYF
jgi:hypothetical protein